MWEYAIVVHQPERTAEGKRPKMTITTYTPGIGVQHLGDNHGTSVFEIINRMGSLGWDLVSVASDTLSFDVDDVNIQATSTTLYLKRKIG